VHSRGRCRKQRRPSHLLARRLSRGDRSRRGRPWRQDQQLQHSAEHVALCAPGERIRTAAIDGYQNATGTSFAAPFAAASAALLHSRAQRRSAALGPETVKRLLIESARPHHPDTPEGNGAGILDTARALALLDQALDADSSTELGGPDDG
jgi:subtilisin family serine protease